MPSQELKPCPFCGAAAAMLNTYIAKPEFGSWYVQCTNQKCRASTLGAPSGASPRSAVIQWNRRAANDKQMTSK